MSRLSLDASLFEFDSDGWLERLRRHERAETLGSLGPYELIAEAGRGGQGVVYRARQPVTGREIAVKRLLAGNLASPDALRRFEREIAAASALNHPGIVAVYGVDFAGGTPLLAMEWVEGVPVTRWALGRSREEVLACFLSVCDAVQHAHQHGVLHRDVKPSNVLVDAGGRARLLDFGLARSFTDPPTTTSGLFVGTPAYAAPEQLEGGELDARADVYSLGAILFEMLTGRRLLEGEGFDAIVRAARALEPPRPSSLERSIPRDLDAIVLQALAHEREDRYQSVDALAVDLRRFLAGAPVLAQAPSAWYLLRKLVARNRLTSALVVTLLAGALVTGIAYGVLNARHAKRLVQERDKALAASTAAEQSRREADDQRRLAEEARDRARKEEERARAEQANTEAVLTFFLKDVIAAAEPGRIGHQPSLLELLQTAMPGISDRFRDAPLVEARVRGVLGDALSALGDYTGAECELRTALAVRSGDAAATPSEIAKLELDLGAVLLYLGKYGEAEETLLSAETRALADDPPSTIVLYSIYGVLTDLYIQTHRYDRCERTTARQIEFANDDSERVAARAARATLTLAEGSPREALAEIDALLPEAIAVCGEYSEHVASLLVNRGTCRDFLGDLKGAEAEFRRALAIDTRMYGPHHEATGRVIGKLAMLLAFSPDSWPEAEDLARRFLAIVQASSIGGLDLAFALEEVSVILGFRGRSPEALPYGLEALALYEKHLGRSDKRWMDCAENVIVMLYRSEKLDEAEELLEQLVAVPGGLSPGVILKCRAVIEGKRGNLERAVELYDQALPLLVGNPGDRSMAHAAFTEFASLLRQMGDEAGAVEIERQARELP